jgi:hypothetical protein
MAKLTHVIATDDHFMSSGELFAIKDKKYEVDREVESGFYISSEDCTSPVHFFYFKDLTNYFYPVYEAEEKPPLGVMPKYLFEEERVRDLCRAVYEYSQYKIDAHTCGLMREWIEELDERLFDIMTSEQLKENQKNWLSVLEEVEQED